MANFILAALLPLAYLLYWTVTAVRRFYFHPLRKFPGPWLAGLTNQYIVYHSWKGDLHLDMQRCHEKYGDYVRYGPDRLLINTAEGVQAIYSSPIGVKKSKIYDVMAYGAHNILTMTDKKLHGHRRRILSQGFSENALRRYDGVICAQIEKLRSVIETDCKKTGTLSAEEKQYRSWSSAFDMAHYCNYLFFDIMTNVVFGVDYNLVQEDKFRHIPQCIEDSNLRMSVIVTDSKWKTFNLDKRLFSHAINSRNRFLRFVGRLLKEKSIQIAAEKDVKRDDVMSLLAGIKDPETGAGLTDRELGAEAVTLVVAGADTSSSSFAAVLFYLVRNPDVYQRVFNEVINAFGSRKSASHGAELNSCIYLRACVEEAMRMSPPVGGPMWREVVEGSNLVIGGRVIPPGVDIGTSAYSIHHNPKYFADPHVYNPSRWLIADSKVTESIAGQRNPRSVFIPFSVGPRGCIGRSLAMREMTLTLATLLLNFDMRIAEGPEGAIGEGGFESAGLGRERAGEYQLYEHITSAKRGPYLQFRLRDAADTAGYIWQ